VSGYFGSILWVAMASMNQIHCTRVRLNVIHAIKPTPLTKSESNFKATLSLKPCTPKLQQPSLSLVFSFYTVVLVKRNSTIVGDGHQGDGGGERSGLEAVHGSVVRNCLLSVEVSAQ